MPADDRAWLTLTLAGVRPADFDKLRARFESATDIVAAKASDLAATGLSAGKQEPISNPDQDRLAANAAWLDNDAHHLITMDDERYPDLLRQISDPPLSLFVHGNPDHLSLPSLAIVGSRNPTDGGKRNAHEFARHLGGAGLCIVSGLAQGIDAAAHRGALEAGAATVAFLGHGIDRVYPASNHDLAHDIVAHGALATEYPLGTEPQKYRFPERNRLISGLSLGTLVVEAARRSGSLITARLAGEQGREVFAIPGSIHNPLSRGCHRLIRQGAKLVEQATDIVDELGALTGQMLQTSEESTPKPEKDNSNDGDYRLLKNCLSLDPVDVDELVVRSGLTTEQVSSMLLILELEGTVEKLSGGRYALQA